MLKGGNTVYKRSSQIAEASKTPKHSGILRKGGTKQLSDITVGYLGVGNVFGDVDVVLNRPYMFTLQSNETGSQVYWLKKDAYKKYFLQYKESLKLIVQKCLETDRRLMKQLAIVTYGYWNKV